MVTEENKKEYVHLVCQMKMTGEFFLNTNAASVKLNAKIIGVGKNNKSSADAILLPC